MLYANNYRLLLVNETWLHAGVSSGLLDPESQYYVLRKDQNIIDTLIHVAAVCVLSSVANYIL